MPRMVLLGLLARAEAFHRGALRAIEENNPFTAFTLLRSYSENAAMLVWLKIAPERISQLDPTNPNAHGLKIGRIIKAAESRLLGFGAIYEQLSAYAHPAGTSLLVSWRPSERESEAGALAWSTVPAFKTDADAEIACFWLVELAEANKELWIECHRLFEALPAESLGRLGGFEHTAGDPE
ncbi:hypothetical protein CLV52_0588 [Amnibacterium kyonggiense]|uniref:Uncharacterized protein n=2 Tax=Amnibacterium kyonggiense TaxID=595671 RepID=A0A4R7FQH2_9MICO|nr:hypothetical protein CLV52_0588 [Amnibacterium kyonggiense]